MSTSKKILLAGAGLICIVLAAALLTHKVLVLQISLPRQDNELLYQAMAAADDILCMCYIHSVERTPVQGWFALDPEGGFRAIRTLSKGTGTGLPNVVHKEKVHMQDGWMIIDEGQAHVQDISFYYLPLNELQISINDHEVDLSRVPSGSRILITCTQKPLISALLGQLFILDRE